MQHLRCLSGFWIRLCKVILIFKSLIWNWSIQLGDNLVRNTKKKKKSKRTISVKPKIIASLSASLFSFPEIVSACKKISLFHLFIVEIQSILESREQTDHTNFWPCPLKNFWSAFNFCESVSSCKKSVYSICISFGYSQL